METPLEMCDRHVSEGLERLARHDAITAGFKLSGRLARVERADFRLRLVEFQTNAEQHAARLRAKVQ